MSHNGDDLHDMLMASKRKRNPAFQQFVAVVVPESNLIAVNTIRTSIKKSFMPCVLSVLEGALTSGVIRRHKSSGSAHFPQRVSGLSGTDPHELLRCARASDACGAVSRAAAVAAVGQARDPITDLQKASSPIRVTRRG